MTKIPTWKANPDLMERLTKAQNNPVHEHIDVLSWAGMCDDRAELLRHVEYCESRAEEYRKVFMSRVALQSSARA